jgi:hypothetical protein
MAEAKWGESTYSYDNRQPYCPATQDVVESDPTFWPNERRKTPTGKSCQADGQSVALALTPPRRTCGGVAPCLSSKARINELSISFGIYASSLPSARSRYRGCKSADIRLFATDVFNFSVFRKVRRSRLNWHSIAASSARCAHRCRTVTHPVLSERLRNRRL